MAPRSVARRVAESYLLELLEDENLPDLLPLYTNNDVALPTTDIVERILEVGAVKVERKRSREHGEIVVLTFAVEPPPED